MMGIRCLVKILLVVGVAALVIYKLNDFSSKSKSFFVEKNKIVKEIDDTKHSEIKLNYIVSASSLYLYKSNDAIVNAIKMLDNDLKILLENRYFQKEYPEIYAKIKNYQYLIKQKVDNVYEFQIYSSAIKNSTMYLSMLLKQFSAKKTYKPPMYKKKLVEAISTIFLSKNSIDKDLVKDIDLEYFQTVQLPNDTLKRFNKMFTAHLKIFKNYYPKYNALLLHILDPKTEAILTKADEDIYASAKAKLDNIQTTLYMLIGFIVSFTIMVVILIIKSEKENHQLNILTNRLQENMRLDSLTKLYNRFKYDEDIHNEKFYGFYLVNIDKFKYINDYYGTKIGDKVLQKVALILKSIIQDYPELKLYRLGADDFGILTSRSVDFQLELKIFEYFEKHEINVGEFQFKISISIAYSEETPYFEKANIALKRIKNSSRIKFLVYSKEIDNKEQILQNIEKTKILYNALKEKKVIPYFQGIADVKTGKIVKYEVLSRVERENGQVESIFPYLQIAKDNKLYSQITKNVLLQSVEIFKENKIPFNINFSIEDIMDESIINILDDIIENDPEVIKCITFEILESESIHDYSIIKNFITNMKKVGAKVAIDDFGSGYSNFEHIINLDIDFIKIDGSLIKNIAIDKNSFNIVSLINSFAKKSGIMTVAEFVEDEQIYNTLKIIGIDYAQGYYFAKPTKKILS